MQSRKSVKSEEECSAKKIPEIYDYVGLKETCPFQDQTTQKLSIHCRSDCAWFSDDECCIWDLIEALRGIRTALERR